MEYVYGFKFVLLLDLFDFLMNNYINYVFLFESNGFWIILYFYIWLVFGYDVCRRRLCFILGFEFDSLWLILVEFEVIKIFFYIYCYWSKSERWDCYYLVKIWSILIEF